MTIIGQKESNKSLNNRNEKNLFETIRRRGGLNSNIAGGSRAGNTGFTLETAGELTYHEYVFEKWTGVEVRSARIRTSAPFFSLSFQFNHILECDEKKRKMTIKGDKSAVDVPPTRITYTLAD